MFEKKCSLVESGNCFQIASHLAGDSVVLLVKGDASVFEQTFRVGFSFFLFLFFYVLSSSPVMM